MLPSVAAAQEGCFTRDPDFEGSHVTTPGPHAIGPGAVVELVSDHDGSNIQMAVIRPVGVPKAPVIVFASPYLNQNLKDGCNSNRDVTRLVENYVPHGYAVAAVAVRGTADSGGCSDLMGPAERADLDQAVRWLGTQAWSTGAVGMVGVSYDGSTPWEVAAAGNPHLKTIVPISGVNDVWHLMYRNGTPETRGAVLLNAIYWADGFLTNPVTGNRSPENTATGFACPEAYQGFVHAVTATGTGERDSQGWWAARNSRPGVEKNWRGPILVVHGLQDWNVDPGHDYPWVNTLEAKGVDVHHLLPQWGHAWPDRGHADNQRMDWADILLEWFDRHLRGLPVDLGAKVQVQDSDLAWREADSWPPKEAGAKRWFFDTNGKMSETAPASESTVLIAAGCVSCPNWTIPAKADAWRISGLPTLHLKVTPSGPGGHVAALIEAVEGATPQFVGWGAVDLRFPDGKETAQPVVPGQPVEVTLPIEPLDAVVPAGHALEITLSQGSYGDHAPSSATPEAVSTGSGSWIDLPLLPEPAPCSFFQPPGASDPYVRPVAPAGRRGFCPRAVPVAAPVAFASRLARIARRPRALRGSSSGPVTAVEVALARRAGRRCAHLTARRRFSRPGSCRARYLRAKGTRRWSLRLPRLQAGRYTVTHRAIAGDGRIEKPRRRTFRVR